MLPNFRIPTQNATLIWNGENRLVEAQDGSSATVAEYLYATFEYPAGIQTL